MASLDAHGVRLTPQRRAVLEALRESPDHPTAAELLVRVRRRHPGVGAATVYRTLDLLTSLGLADQLTVEGTGTRFDPTTARHDHLVCDRCGRVDDVDLPPPQLDRLDAAPGFAVTGYDLTVHGVCPDCRRAAPDPPSHPSRERA